ncbi:rare lipoprotein A [Modicisalibacter muralis]|uniref:Endolytic peptidoglycan transglycosylase RlpA n=1 Tax=Modicisalibacter muralis TaxID=119000 RepID=A0A1G9MPL0_9GAMM|nr:septal ring lytic transglycosylase RlpA family protein [Halomonas muralis]SDL76044.1 rare lipoprotein A [Halomonas muralis]
MTHRWLFATAVLALLAGCASGGGVSSSGTGGQGGGKDSGGRYAMESDAYPEQPPDVSNVPDAVPRVEPLARSGNRPVYEVWGETYHVLSDATGYVDQGKASWYGKKFHGYATASGEIYDMYEMTAAHRSLPLPTYARVTNLDNGRSVIVKVNDRGPFHGDRLIDLSYAAAARLDILRGGTGRVRVEAIDPVAWQARHQGQQSTRQAGTAPVPAPQAAVASAPAAQSPASVSAKPLPASTASSAGSAARSVASGGEQLYLQVAALGSATSALELQARLQSELDSPVRIESGTRLHRVQVGPVNDRIALEALRRELSRVGYADSFTVSAND